MNPRILIVDDEAAMLFAYRKLIEREGLEVDICDNLEDAVRQVAIHSYLAVIADMRLAGTGNVDGLEVLRRVRQQQPSTKVIIITGYGSDETEKAAFTCGAAYYFEKPVAPSSLLEVLKLLHCAAGDEQCECRQAMENSSDDRFNQ